MINSIKRRSVTYNVMENMRSISLSKFFPALCHTLIYEMVIFYSIKLESCNICKGCFLTRGYQTSNINIVCSKIMTQYKILILNIEEHDKSSDIEQKPPFGDRK